MSVNVFLLVIVSCCINIVYTKSDWLIATEGKCQFTINNGFSILFIENPTLFVNKEHAPNLNGCRNLCCSHDTCNGYVWNSLETVENCKLLKCSSQGQDCKHALHLSDNLKAGQVGFVTGYNEANDEPLVDTTVQPITKSKFTSAATKLKQTPVTRPFATKLAPKIPPPVVTKHVANVNAVPKNSNWLIQRFNAMAGNVSNDMPSPPNISSKKNAEKNNQTTTTTAISKIHRVPALHGNTTHKQTTVIVEQTPHATHTDVVSLAAALLIGVGFLVSVLVMVGRRWIESIQDCHKREYRRISYLLNGV